MNESNKDYKWERRLSFMVVVLPLLSQYGSTIPGLSLADVSIAIVLFILLLQRKLKISLTDNKLLIIFFFLTTCQSLLSFLFQGDLNLKVLTRLIRYIFLMLVLISSLNIINRDQLLVRYMQVSKISALYIIIQFLGFQLTGKVLPIKILPFPWYDGRIYNSTEALIWAEKWFLRPSGFFLEPSYAAQYLLPSLVLSLFNIKHSRSSDEKSKINFEKKNLSSSLLIGSALILSTSNIAVFLTVFIIFIYWIINVSEKRFNYHTLLTNSVLILVAIAFWKRGLLSSAIEYLKNNSYVGGSTSFRIMKGPATYLALPFLLKIFGVGFGNIGTYMIKNGIYTQYDTVNRTLLEADYVNGFSAVATYHGIFLLFFWCYILFHYYSRSQIEGKLITVIYTILMVVSSIYISYNAILYFCLIDSFRKE